MIIGVFLFATGAAWLVMTFFYFPKHRSAETENQWSATDLLSKYGWASMATEDKLWAWMVYTVHLWSGFWVGF